MNKALSGILYLVRYALSSTKATESTKMQHIMRTSSSVWRNLTGIIKTSHPSSDIDSTGTSIARASTFDSMNNMSVSCTS